MSLSLISVHAISGTSTPFPPPPRFSKPERFFDLPGPVRMCTRPDFGYCNLKLLCYSLYRTQFHCALAQRKEPGSSMKHRDIPLPDCRIQGIAINVIKKL